MLRKPNRSAFVAFLVVGVIASACGQGRVETTGSETATANPDPVEAVSHQDMTVEQLWAMMADDDPFLVNVHVPFEGDIPGTDQSIRFDEIADHLDQLPESRESVIVLYCRSGRMSEEAATVLASLGYTSVFNLKGGFRAWEAAGHPIKK